MTEAKTATKKKVVAAKKPATHPKYIDMIIAAIVALKERSGSSRQAIQKYIQANYKIDSVGGHLKLALKSGVAKGTLKQVKGVGASGSFKVGQKSETKPKPKPAKKPAAKKTTSAAKKPAAKKTTKKANTTPKKKAAAKKTSSAKKPKSAARKPVAKKPKAKKTPKKKTAAKKSKK